MDGWWIVCWLDISSSINIVNLSFKRFINFSLF
jgi:hypothetical protein